LCWKRHLNPSAGRWSCASRLRAELSLLCVSRLLVVLRLPGGVRLALCQQALLRKVLFQQFWLRPGGHRCSIALRVCLKPKTVLVSDFATQLQDG
jgi:hypothetical protein